MDDRVQYEVHFLQKQITPECAILPVFRCSLVKPEQKAGNPS